MVSVHQSCAVVWVACRGTSQSLRSQVTTHRSLLEAKAYRGLAVVLPPLRVSHSFRVDQLATASLLTISNHWMPFQGKEKSSSQEELCSFELAEREFRFASTPWEDPLRLFVRSGLCLTVFRTVLAMPFHACLSASAFTSASALCICIHILLSLFIVACALLYDAFCTDMLALCACSHHDVPALHTCIMHLCCLGWAQGRVLPAYEPISGGAACKGRWWDGLLF